jgi:asparagine synthase (glutamine-hydrolysing)
MCGIAGFVDFTGLPPRSDEVLRRMASTLDRRGPDSSGVWCDAHAALAFRRLAVIDPVGGGQPMVANDDGRPVAVLDYTGEVFNFVELRTELQGYGHTFRTASDTEVVLRAYQQWGADCAHHLVGMFAFAVWDVRTRELVLIRDRFGIYPLFYAVRDGGVVFASEPKAVLAHPCVPAVVDLDGLREMLSFAPVPGRSAYQGIAEVKPGHCIVFSAGKAVSQCYWRLTAMPHTDGLVTTVDTVRQMLERSVTEQMVADVPICTQLSGGLDSSAVAALAARAVGGRLRTFSLDFTGHAARARRSEMYGDPDAPYARRVAEWIGSDHTEIVLDSADLLDDGARAEVVRALDAPAAAGDLYTSLYLLCQRLRTESTVSITGDGADEYFGGFRWFHDDWYRNAVTFPWLAASHKMEMATGLLDRDLVGRLDLDGAARQNYSDALAEVPQMPGDDALERRVREITYLNITRYLRVVLDRKDRMGMASSLEGRVPFLDHRLVEYVSNVPWSLRSFDGREKSLLRAAAADLLPPEVLTRVKAPFPTTTDPAYAAGLRERLALLLADSDAPVHALLDRDRAQAALRGPDFGARLGVTRHSVDAALQLNRWLTDRPVVLSL